MFKWTKSFNQNPELRYAHKNKQNSRMFGINFNVISIELHRILALSKARTPLYLFDNLLPKALKLCLNTSPPP